MNLLLLGEKLRLRRRTLGLTLAYISDRTRVSLGYLSTIERAESRPATGKPSVPKQWILESWLEALELDEEATTYFLDLAGYAGRQSGASKRRESKIGTPNFKTPVLVIGLGGSGKQIALELAKSLPAGIKIVAIDTTQRSLDSAVGLETLAIGKHLTKGLGAGGDIERGRCAAEESSAEIKTLVAGAQVVCICAGLGGGTGTGAAPTIAKIAKDAGALTVGLVSLPFSFEGSKRTQRASVGLMALRQRADSLITIPCDRVLGMCSTKASFEDALQMANVVLSRAARDFCLPMTHPPILDLEFSDLRRILSNAGPCLLSVGAGSGENRGVAAAEALMRDPLTVSTVRAAHSVVFNVIGNRSLSLPEVNSVAEAISRFVNPEAEVVFGAVVDEALADEVRVTIVATHFDSIMKKNPLPSDPSFVDSLGVDSQNQPNPFNEMPLFLDDIPSFLRRASDENDNVEISVQL